MEAIFAFVFQLVAIQTGLPCNFSNLSFEIT